ncbi:proton-conducting transporter membrane subunit [Thermococcus sp. GR6]|uniref:proton-conducting transporter transmembrane domain-containing protein n=1 Tax=Thermococcus sp. GR6 TaxID=1638256 RepID=UPI00143087BB|nr:proton-conducting transporter membrane subunit [Thermococcus sp. GR6]NJE41749.1 hydantoin racemase [Thermococcus sp. GR6]
MEVIFLFIVIILSVASFIGVFSRSAILTKLVNALSALGSLTIAYAGIIGLKESVELNITLLHLKSDSIINAFSTLTLKVDPLSGFFMIILGILGFCTSVYGIAYLDMYKGDKRLYAFNYPLFLLFMFLVLVSWNLLWFVVFWELMTLFSQFLVAFERNEKTLIATLKYFCMTKAAADFMLIAIVLVLITISGGGDYDILSSQLVNYFRSHPLEMYLVSAGFMIGLGVKAALVPFHVWLPDAYVEAPSNVSSLLSGAMEKMPVYMMFRFFLSFTPLTPNIGLLIALFGTLTLFFGTMYALKQTDSKRLLSYHSVGQIGYVVFALGAGIYLLSKGYTTFGALALMASLFHALNHAFFKGLLFLTAGSILYRTGSRDLDHLGGLARFMPITAFAALIGSLSIAGMPPFNGFVSKWMIYVSTLPTPTLVSLFGALALFISAVTTASFVKYFTSIFVRPPAKEITVKEVPVSMWASQLILAVLCVIFGVYPALPLEAISKAVDSVGVTTPSITVFPGLIVSDGIGNIAPLALLVFSGALTAVLLAIFPYKISLPVWTTGTRKSLAMRLPASSYYASFEEEFEDVYSWGEWCVCTTKRLWDATKAVLSSFEEASFDLDKMMTGAWLMLLILLTILGGVLL